MGGRIYQKNPPVGKRIIFLLVHLARPGFRIAPKICLICKPFPPWTLWKLRYNSTRNDQRHVSISSHPQLRFHPHLVEWSWNMQWQRRPLASIRSRLPRDRFEMNLQDLKLQCQWRLPNPMSILPRYSTHSFECPRELRSHLTSFPWRFQWFSYFSFFHSVNVLPLRSVIDL